MAKTVAQTALAAFLACSVLATARCGVVSLVDVTGTSPPRPQDAEPNGVSFVGYPEPASAPPARRPGQGGVVSLSDVTGLTPEQHAVLDNAYAGPPRPGHAAHPGSVNLVDVNGVAQQRPPRPGQGGVVSLTDVTGVAPQFLAHPPPPPPPPPPHPYPLHPERGYDLQRPYSPCYVPGAGPAYTVPQHPAGAAHLGGERLPRSRRSPRPGGVVRLEDVAGPGAGRYPSFGPPAYVRPSYNYGYGWYGRPRPYYNVYPAMPLACFGLWCL